MTDETAARLTGWRAHSWAMTTNLDKDDLIQEGWLVYDKIRKDKPSTTFLVHALNNRFSNLNRPRPWEPVLGIRLHGSPEPRPDKVAGFADVLDSLDADDKIVADIVLNQIAKVFQFDEKLYKKAKIGPRHIRGALRKYLERNLGWGRRRIDSAFHHLAAL